MSVFIGGVNDPNFEIGGWMYLQPRAYSPDGEMVDVVGATEKAIQVRNKRGTTIWLPKSSLAKMEAGGGKFYTFKDWFVKINNGKSMVQVMRLFRQ